MVEARLDEPTPDLRADLIAARTNGRTHGRQQVGWLAPERSRERRDRLLGHARRQTSPTRVDRGHGTRARIREKERYAVGHLNGQCEVRIARDEDVRFDGRVRAADSHGGPVNLLNVNQLLRVRLDGRGHFVPAGGAVGARRNAAEPPVPCSEQMNGDGVQIAADERQSAIDLNPRERRRGARQYHALIMPDIVGLGVDATDIPRIERTIARYGDRFIRRIFTEVEIAYCMRRRFPAIHFAGRFAAKEAAMKALGTGHTPEVLWRDVEVVRHGGPPQLRFHHGSERRFRAIGGASSLLTITHSDALALAQVMILGPASQT